MKRALLFLLILINSFVYSQSTFIGLVVETVDNSSGGFTNGEVTYRLYAELSDGIITQLNGDESNPVLVSTTTSFFNQDLFGSVSNLQSDVNNGAFGFIPAFQFDTWVGLGDSYSSAPSTIGDLGFDNNLSGSSWNFGGTPNSDASIFRTPDDPLCIPDANGLVLLGQFTTSGELSGYLNLEGQDALGNPWIETNILFSSSSPQEDIPGCIDSTAFNFDPTANVDDGSCIPFIFGCTDNTASNYNSLANTDDGSCTYISTSTFIGLVVETVDNSSGGFTNGEVTYRLYAELSDGIITQLNGDESNPVLVSTTTSFFNQDLFGSVSNLQSDVNNGAFGFIPALQFDTWVGLGDSYSSAPSTIGDLGFDNNLSGSSWNFGGTPNSDASIFRTPDDPLCIPDANGLVLLGQFTTSGELSGYLNLEGQDAAGNPWIETNILFSSSSAQEDIPGCIDSTAFNFDPTANVDDGSCEYCQIINSVFNNSACDSFDWNGVTYTESGTYTFATTNATGCDSTATLNLTINNSSSSSEDVTACDSFDWNGVTYTESGTYTFESTNESGCDSTATLNLTINNSSSSSDDVTACDSFDWNGVTYTESGTYTFESTNESGCTHTATLNLTINNSSSSSDDVTACDSFDWNGVTYTESGTYTFNY